VVAYWTSTHGVAGSNSGQVKTFAFSFMQLPCYYFTYNKELICTKICIFRKSTIHYCIALLQVALVSTPPHKFVRPPCWYYRLYEIEEYDFRVVLNGMTSIPNFIQIRPAVLYLNHEDWQTNKQPWPVLYAFISCTSCRERIKTRKRFAVRMHLGLLWMYRVSQKDVHTRLIFRIIMCVHLFGIPV
jgi:hypothetical protein